MRIETEYRTYDNVFLRVERYMADSSLCILLYNRDYAVIAKLTTCLDDKRLKDNEAYIDTNNCPWAIDFINDYAFSCTDRKEKDIRLLHISGCQIQHV